MKQLPPELQASPSPSSPSLVLSLLIGAALR
jgi:hypothetical protein